MLKDLLKQQSNSPLSLSKNMLGWIIKGYCIALYNTVLLAQENANLRIANKVVKKRKLLTRHIPCEKGLIVEEGLQLVAQPYLPAEASTVESHGQGELPIQADLPAKRALPRYSGCREGRLATESIHVETAISN